MIWGYGTNGRDVWTTRRVTGEAANLADHALSHQSHHQRGAVTALRRTREGSNQELVGFVFHLGLWFVLENNKVTNNTSLTANYTYQAQLR